MSRNLYSKTIQSHWTGGFLGNRLEACRNKMIPHMWQILNNSSLSHCWQNFLIAAGEAEGEHSGPPFHDGDFYKWLEGASRLYGDSSDPYWSELLDSIIETITKVQRADGYIFTYDAIQRKNGGEYSALANDLNFEVYNMGHLMSAACVHFRISGKTTLLDLAENSAHYLTAQFSSLDESVARTAICPSHYMGLAQLYRTTGKSEYLDLLEKLIQLRDSVPDGSDDNQDRIPLKEQRDIRGHAVRANYLYAGLTDLYVEREDKEYRSVLESVWNDLVSKKLYLTGGCGALYDGVSPYGCDDYNYIQRTHQSYGRAYELPQTNGYNETCAAIGFYLWNYRMTTTFGESKYTDYMELAFYNTILTGINLEGDHYFYTNALRCLDDLPHSLKWSRHRESYLTSFCCPPNVVRTIAETADMMCIEKEKGLALLLYGNSRISYAFQNGQECTFEIQTNYPWSGSIELLIETCTATAPFPLFLRIPEWADHYTISINGNSPDSNTELHNGFLRLNRIWKEGDRVSLELEMKVKFIESHPMVEESRNQIALVRGPIVYCLETADIPLNSSISQMYIDPKNSFTPKMETMGSTEMVMLKGDIWYSPDSEWKEGDLYRSHKKKEYKKVPVSLIPYFAWDNREKGEMTVWLPLLPD